MNEVAEKVREVQSGKTFDAIMQHLPYNRDKLFCTVHLAESRCDLIIPLRGTIEHKAQEVKDFYQKLVEEAKL